MAMNDDERSVTVLGLGNMGAAIADALIAKGNRVTVWNRSPDKATEQIAAGATLSETPADAVNSSEIILICVSDAAACKDIFSTEGFAAVLQEKILVQFSTMTPEEACDLASWVTDNGAGYLDGSILGLPEGVREGILKILYSGPEALLKRAESVLAALGESVWLGEQTGLAYLADKIVYAQYYGIHFTYLFAAALGQAAGISVENLTMIIGGEDRWKVRGQMVDAALDMASKRDYSGDECALDVHLAAFEHTAQLSKETGIGIEFTQMIVETMREAIDRGHAKDELPAIFEVLFEKKH
jgi:3-hydroxyisobutyrate dehydrogenase-like beta-hydroxyacid dehydrogenase